VIDEDVDKRKREREERIFKITGMSDNGGADKDSVYEYASGRVGYHLKSVECVGEIERSSKQAYINKIIFTTRRVYNETSHNKHF
jgi:hypothetical protein